MHYATRAGLIICGFFSLLSIGCWTPQTEEVVVYTALDTEFSEPIFEDFTAETGIVVLPRYDTEATKTVGLANSLIAEADRPRADVFWNNEILNTLRLHQRELLASYRPVQAEDYPEAFQAEDGTWHGFAARARILIVNRDQLAEEARPSSIEDLIKPEYKGQVAIAKPLFGTTATHAACLFAAWGPEKAKAFFTSLKENEVQVLSGNKQVALAVAQGKVPMGLTDTDDAIGVLEAGQPVEIIYLDREEGELGTLFIPNTLAIIEGGPHPEAARKLVDYLLSPEVEAKLAEGPSAQIPLFEPEAIPVRIETPRTVKAMEVNFSEAADYWDETATFLTDHFTTGS
ncbi:ABC transporter substrate binding component [Planctomycetales bacterium 10988]|nr:ABC transporter substrate binding component [Planctomycetales bacterium 10988]